MRNALVVGGGTIGYYLASLLIEMKIKVRIIESRKERCEELSDLLPEATIICGDGTDKSFSLRKNWQMQNPLSLLQI